MKKVKLGASIVLAVSVSMVAACQIGAPNQPETGERATRQGAGTPTVNTPENKGGQLGDTPLRQSGDAKLVGKVVDQNGNPVAGALVKAGDSATRTGADGSYSLQVESGQLVNVKVLKDGFILRDSTFPVPANGELELTATLVEADDKVTRITAAEGGKAVSADGEVELIFPAGALAGDSNVRVTWLDPQEAANKPAAFRIKALADTAEQGGEAAPVEDPNAETAPAEPAGPTVTELNTSELPGPLETKAYGGDKKYFSPVSFADVAMSAPLKEGETATLRMAISQEVLDDMFRQGDLKESDLGQEIFPCFSWSTDASTWDKPALSKVVKDENGKYWYEYTVRSNNMSGAGAAGYQALQIGDQEGFAQVTLVVGGGRRVVDGTYTYGALIERSSDAAYDFKGLSATLRGGTDWTNRGGDYRSPDRSNIVRPNVRTDSYTGTVYASQMGADNFSKWDRNGAFRLQFPPGVRFEIESPSVFGLTAGQRTGRTNTAAQAYLTPDPTGQSSAQQNQNIVSTYTQPFYYHTDATLTLVLKQNGQAVGDADLTGKYTWRGTQTETALAVRGGRSVIKLPRNANGSAVSFTLNSLGTAFFLEAGTQPSKAGITPGSSHTLEVAVTQAEPK